jgi:STE24 endopeptidase
VSLEAHQKAADYTIARSRLGMFDLAVDVALALALTIGGGIDALDRGWRQLDLPSIVTGVGVIGSVGVIGAAVGLPLSAYCTFVIEERFGFNRTTLRTFLADVGRGAALGAALGLPLVVVVLWLMGLSNGAWWLAVWAVWFGFSLFVSWAYPTLIAPRFNTFRKLEDAALEARITALLERCGFASKGIYVMDGSRRSSHGNAYFTGLGRQKRIVFFDTLLDDLKAGEIEAVLAHELGHFRQRHVLKNIVLTGVYSFGVLALLGWLVDRSWFYAGLGVDEPSRHAALALLLVAGPAFAFFLGPVLAAVSRRFEAEADDFAVAHAQAADLIEALTTLYEANATTLTPDPVHSAFYDSHPPAPVRIARLAASAAEDQGPVSTSGRPSAGR